MQHRQCLWAGMIVALGLSSGPAIGGLLRNQAIEVVGAGAVSDPLIAVEANRAAIVNRLATEFGDAAAQAGVNAETLRAVLGALRADQLLAASLVGTFAELTAIVVQTPSDGVLLQRYVALTPVVPQSLSVLPFAQAYLTREGDTLTVTRAQDLRLGEAAVVGYFVAGSSVVGGGLITPKDGPGSGANSWIGYTAGSNVASGSGSAVAAGTFNAATNVNASVFAGQSNVASGISSLVIGGFDNRATGIDAIVGAGAGHRATGARSVVVGGGYNLASGQWSFIGGGGRDGVASTPAGTNALDNIASGNFSVVTGGQGNRAAGNFATVPGGNTNLASGVGSFAAGTRAKTQTAGGSPVIHNGTFAFADGSLFDFNTAASNEFAVRATGGVRFVTAIDGAGLPTKTLTLSSAGHVSLPGNLNVSGTLTAPGLGTVTNLSPSTGITLTPNPITATGTIAVDTTAIQARVTGTCAAGSSIRAITANGTVVCETDDVGTGTVTSVGTGPGLAGGPITTSGTINLATTQLLPTAACTSGQVPSWNGSAWGCSTLESFSGNIDLADSASASVGNVTKAGTRFMHNYAPGTFNTFLGQGAGNFTTFGIHNTGIGAGVLTFITTGQENSGTGVSALLSTTDGYRNTAMGAFASHANTSGYENTASGAYSLVVNTVGQGNTAYGAYALYWNTTDYQTAVGSHALYSNTTGAANTAIGANALYSNTTGQSNVATGVNALRFNTTGTDNTSVGNSALTNNTSGTKNTAIGGSALFDNTIGFSNVALGYQALLGNTTGGANTAIGFRALSNVTTEIGNTAVGHSANVSGGNATAIGFQAFADASDRVRIGNTSITQIGGQVAWSNLSDRRDKKDIADSSLGLDFVKALRPVQFKLLNGNDRIDFGFIAQEVEALVGTEYNVLGIGATAQRKLSLRYTDFIAPMVKAIQQQQGIIASQQAQIDELRRAVEILMARTQADQKVAAVR